MNRTLASCLVSAVLAAPLSTASAGEFSLRLIGSTSIATGTLFQGVEFGGISGLDRDADGTFWAISDDRGGERGTPRFYNLSLNYDAAAFHGVTINSQTYMLRPDGTTFPGNARTVDPEGIRVAPSGNLYWSSEGNWSANSASRYQPNHQRRRDQGGEQHARGEHLHGAGGSAGGWCRARKASSSCRTLRNTHRNANPAPRRDGMR